MGGGQPECLWNYFPVTNALKNTQTRFCNLSFISFDADCQHAYNKDKLLGALDTKPWISKNDHTNILKEVEDCLVAFRDSVVSDNLEMIQAYYNAMRGSQQPKVGDTPYTQFQPSKPEQKMNELLLGKRDPADPVCAGMCKRKLHATKTDCVAADVCEWIPNQVDIVFFSHDDNSSIKIGFKKLLADRQGLSSADRASILAEGEKMNREQLE